MSFPSLPCDVDSLLRRNRNDKTVNDFRACMDMDRVEEHWHEFISTFSLFFVYSDSIFGELNVPCEFRNWKTVTTQK